MGFPSFSEIADDIADGAEIFGQVAVDGSILEAGGSVSVPSLHVGSIGGKAVYLQNAVLTTDPTAAAAPVPQSSREVPPAEPSSDPVPEEPTPEPEPEPVVEPPAPESEPEHE